ncbi:MAG: glucosyltransferase domain-containing protein [Treponema sp.]|nr:glucosyltransferase domain-containing protein [Treponema sp.]
MLFFTYGIRLFWYSIGVDTEQFMADKDGLLRSWLQIGRFGLVSLSKLWYIKEFNPFTAFFTAFCLIWFFTISWCYIIAIFCRNTGRINKLIPFALVFMTMPVWAEQFYFLLQAAETAFIISLCPYVIYLLYKGFLDGEKGKIICASIMLVFMTSVYQAIVPLFCCGVFACFVLLQEQTDYEPQVYRSLCLKLFITLVGSMVVYFFIDRIIIHGFFHIEKSTYVDDMNQWGQVPVRQNIINILLFGYTITIGHIPLVQDMVNPIIASYARTGMRAAEFIANSSRVSGNILLLPVTVLFLVKTISQRRRLLYILAGIGIPMCIMLLTIMGGNKPPVRSLWALPLAFAFMLFYLIISYKKKVASVIACLALITAVYQAQITAQVFYSDQVRYNEDVRLAHELNDLITQVQPDNEKLPVALIGKYQTASRFHSNFLQGEVIGHSFFEWDFSKPSNPTGRGLAFMKSLGFYYDIPNGEQMDQAVKEVILMPSYPEPGCVRRVGDFIVVRISDTLYE